MVAKHGVEPDELRKKLRQFIRTKGSGYLEDPNVSSIGIGYKQRDGKPTDELAIQFTVDTKAGLDALEELGTEPIPATITVDGIEIPTDVIQRSYRPDFRVVAEAETVPRKTRQDPIQPGISVSHTAVSAGTIGCVVYDRADGTPYVLSNWHILQGRTGNPGDVIVQPGIHDDNRADRNRLGVLARSHLGPAGDCAIATIEDREFRTEILEIGITPDKLGEPELGDTVIKSGRTTGVTYGKVRRVDTLAKINYGDGIGVRNIGCFEIGVDTAHEPADGEISQGGDSGSIWLFTRKGKPTSVIAGLHFGGETGGSTDEHALACLPHSVFEKLEISLAAPEVPETVGTGYDAGFLGTAIAVPTLTQPIKGDAVTLNGSGTIAYTHFSLALSKSRRFARWVAWNIDGGSLKALSRNSIPFVKDPRLPDGAQVGDELYSGNSLDRGHLARRADLLWGPVAEARKANTDSFYFTNITPQMDDFNQSARHGVWGELEDALFADVDVDSLKISVFGGPILQSDDRVYRTVRIPREFWKLLAYQDKGVLRAKAFLLTQNLNQLEALELDEFRAYQVTLAELEQRTALRFPAVLHDAEPAPEQAESLDTRRPLDSPSDITWT